MRRTANDDRAQRLRQRNFDRALSEHGPSLPSNVIDRVSSFLPTNLPFRAVNRLHRDTTNPVTFNGYGVPPPELRAYVSTGPNDEPDGNSLFTPPRGYWQWDLDALQRILQHRDMHALSAFANSGAWDYTDFEYIKTMVQLQVLATHRRFAEMLHVQSSSLVECRSDAKSCIKRRALHVLRLILKGIQKSVITREHILFVDQGDSLIAALVTGLGTYPQGNAHLPYYQSITATTMDLIRELFTRNVPRDGVDQVMGYLDAEEVQLVQAALQG